MLIFHYYISWKDILKIYFKNNLILQLNFFLINLFFIKYIIIFLYIFFNLIKKFYWRFIYGKLYLKNLKNY